MAVVIDYLRNSSLRKKLFPAIVLNIALAELFGNVGSAMGFPDNGAAICWAQGIITGSDSHAMCSFAYLSNNPSI